MTVEARTAGTRVAPVVLTVGCAVAGLAVTAVARVSPFTRLAYRSIPAHVSLETADAMIAAVVAYLAYGRLRRTERTRDLLLASAFGVLAVSDLVLATGPGVLGDGVPSGFNVWALLVLRLAASVLLAVAALVPPSFPARRAGRGLAAAAAAVVAALVVLALIRHSLPAAVHAGAVSATDPGVVGNPVALGLQVALVVPMAVAAAAFTARAQRGGDPLDAWIGAGATLGAFARVDYVLVPSLYSDWIYTGDLLRTAFYVVLLVGAAGEIRAYWASHAEAAVFAERRRVARDLHDGAVQEIGYIRTLAMARARADTDDMEAGHIVAAAERALDEMRSALTALTAPLDEPLLDTVRRAASEVADRYDVAVEVIGSGPVPVTHAEREAVVRIVREAVSNAARHGAASKVTVELTGPQPRAVVIRDDGRGFDPAERGSGFGLTAMEDRAAGLAGALSVDSASSGTTVTVTW